MKERILVVDDDKEIVRLVRSYLEKAGYEVFTAYDGDTAVHALRRENPHVIVLDLMLPDIDGWDITRLIRRDERLSKTIVIMLTARVEDSDKIVGLEMGADDYMTKPFNPAEVVARVRAQLRFRERVAAPDDGPGQAEVLQVGSLLLDVGKREVLVSGTAVDLTPTEFNLLYTLMQNPGYVFTRSELIEHGLGHEYVGMDRTLDSHIKNLRRKVEPDHKNPAFIQTVYGIGYRLIQQS